MDAPEDEGERGGEVLACSQLRKSKRLWSSPPVAVARLRCATPGHLLLAFGLCST